MTTTAGTILDRRLVATGETGTAEWRLIQGEDGLSNWAPCFEHPDGKVENPKFLPLPGSQQSFLSCPIYETLYHGTRGPGKAVAGNTPVLTNKGWIDANEVTMKHKLVAVDGSYTEIKGVYPQGNRELFRVTFDDGTWVDCDDNHLWDVKQARYGKKDEWRTRSTKHIREKMQEWGEKKTGKSDYFYIPVMEGFAPAQYKNGQFNGFDGHLSLVASARDTKDIPKALLLGEPELRYAAAQAYMDNFGCVDSKNSLRFVHHRIEKVEDMAYLLRSLGCKVNSIGKDPQNRYRFTFQPPKGFVPFKDEDKLKKYRESKTQARKRIISISSAGEGDAVCFEVADKRRLFIIKDFIVTHNTMTLLMDFAADVNKGYGKAWRGILFRREYKDLDDVAKKIEEWFPKIFEGFRFLKSKAEYMAIWKDGESLLLRVGEGVDDYDNYHGHEYPWIGFEELTQWEDDKLYRKMFSCNRTGVPGIKCRIRATTNPFGCVKFGDVLTSDRGWVPIQDVKEGEYVVSADEHGNFTTARVLETVKLQEDSVEMITRQGRGLFMEFTEDHRLPHLNTAKTEHSMKEFNRLPGEAIIRRTADNWKGEEIRFKQISLRSEKDKQPMSMTGNQYAAFMGWFLSEGCALHRDKGFSISQSKPEHVETIKKLMDGIGFKYNYDGQAFVVYSKKWYEYLKQFGKCRNKFVPSDIKGSTEDQLRLFFDAAVAGDGHTRESGGGAYYTTSEKLADDMMEIATKLGFRVFTGARQRDNRDGLSYEVNFSKGAPTTLNTGNHVYSVNSVNNNVNVTRENFSGEVYCLVVENTESFFIRQKGCVWMSGNCGHNWVKKRFRLPDQDGKVIREAGHKDRVAIFGSIYENFLLLHSDPDYPQTVYNAATSHAEGRAWLYGDWEVTAGGMFDDLWESSIHVVPTLDAYQIPLSWNISRSYDHGQSHPFAVLWWAESSGEPIELPDGRYIGGQRGDLFLIHEWYGNQGEEDNVGLKMPSKEIATGIRQREMEMGIWGRCMPGPADTEIFNKLSDRENRGPSDDMEDEGIYWERADKSPGSRKRGYEVVRTKLKAAKPGEDGTRSDPGLFVCENCRWWIQLVPTVPRSGKDPDEIPDGYPDHLIDPTRYRVTWNRPIVKRSSF